MKNKIVHRFIIGTFVSLYLLVSVISTIHVIDFFKLSNPYWLAVSLAVAFELGAAASLASLVILDKMNRTLVWVLFATITLMQMQGNMYYAFVNMEGFQGWSELFGLMEEDVIYQKRVLAAVSGAILPLVALGFIKSLVDYIKPENNSTAEEAKTLEESNLAVQEDLKTGDQESEVKEEVVSLPEEEKELKEDKNFTLQSTEESSPKISGETLLEEVSEVPSDENKVVSGYYGDIVIDGNGVKTEETQILPVNANKKGSMIDQAGKVHINPMRL